MQCFHVHFIRHFYAKIHRLLLRGALSHASVHQRSFRWLTILSSIEVNEKDLNVAATSAVSVVSTSSFDPLLSKDKQVANASVPLTKTLEMLSLLDKSNSHVDSSTLFATGTPTASVPKDDKPTNPPTKDKDFSVGPVSKDDKTTSVSTVGSDKTLGRATSLPSKDDKTPIASGLKVDKAPSRDDKTPGLSISSSDKTVPLYITTNDKVTKVSGSPTNRTSKETSSVQGKDKDLASSLATGPIKSTSTDKALSSLLSKDGEKDTNVSDEDKTLGPLEIVYSLTVPVGIPVTSGTGLGFLRPVSLAASGLHSAVAHPSTAVFDLSNPSLTVLSLKSASKIEIPGYQIVPSPTQGPTKGSQQITGSATPVYTPAMLGNAYGGGFIITPSIYVTKRPSPNGPSEGVPPGYGSSSNVGVSSNGSVLLSSSAAAKDKLPVVSPSQLAYQAKDETSSLEK